jgi:DNA-damage-inducible protein J
MAKSANIYARIEPEVKKEAESILEELGIPVSVAINMFYKRIIASKGMPFEIKIEDSGTTDITNMSEEEIIEVISKAKKSIKEGKGRSAEEVFKSLKKEYNI